MCGIAGVVAPAGASPDRAVLQRMASVMEHRGPDDEGIEVRGRVGLVHRRLTILDLSAAGHQPMVHPERRVELIFNGEIYNYQALKQELIQAGHRFIGTSDTEVLLHGYLQWGTACFERFNGMFAVAILDAEQQKLVLARDRTGIKPIVLADLRGSFLFASESKSLLAAGVTAELDDPAVAELILTGHTEGRRTFLRGISHLPAGSFLEYDLRTSSRRVVRYHDLRADVRPVRFERLLGMSDAQVVAETERLLSESVRMHLVADVPVGTLCSGGVDSSLITAMAVRHKPDVHILHAAVGDGLGEQEYAAKVAEHLKISIDYFTLRREIYLDSLPMCVAQSELPLYHPNDIPLYHICRTARERGLKVLLAGEGADELFGGYTWFASHVKHLRRLQWFQRMPRKLGSFLARNVAPFNLDETELGFFYAYPGARSLPHKASFLLGQGERRRRYELAAQAYSFVPDRVERHALAFLLDHLYGHLDSILLAEDRMGMLASIEIRVPFLENALMELACNLPLRFKYRDQQCKWLLKKVAERFIPRGNVYRKKMGFPAPWQDYVRIERALFAGGFCEDYLGTAFDDLKAETDRLPDLAWSLLNLELFGRIFLRGESPDELRERLVPRKGSAVPALAPA